MSPRDRFRIAVCTVGGLGLLPFARGTAGTGGGLLLFLPLAWGCRNAPTWVLPAALLAGAALATALLVRWGDWLEARLGGKDPQSVVLDEVAGLFVTYAAVPLGIRQWDAPRTWIPILAGFCLFRLFDVAKPPPCRRIQALPGGWGIAVDDLVAGVYANLCLQVFVRWTGGG